MRQPYNPRGCVYVVHARVRSDIRDPICPLALDFRRYPSTRTRIASTIIRTSSSRERSRRYTSEPGPYSCKIFLAIRSADLPHCPLTANEHWTLERLTPLLQRDPLCRWGSWVWCVTTLWAAFSNEFPRDAGFSYAAFDGNSWFMVVVRLTSWRGLYVTRQRVSSRKWRLRSIKLLWISSTSSMCVVLGV